MHYPLGVGMGGRITEGMHCARSLFLCLRERDWAQHSAVPDVIGSYGDGMPAYGGPPDLSCRVEQYRPAGAMRVHSRSAANCGARGLMHARSFAAGRGGSVSLATVIIVGS